ncbi:TPA: molecular chaperone HtpG [Candidatus Marinimicrobia bacterium]|nr:MAG: molecular chaperone of HSP90 family [Marinimicrobia bacterium 46_43]HAE87389.1 molecular chaperone HtpG [Candidatus Neomarinimicrobiota bacterium]
MTDKLKTYEYQTEIKKILDIVIHSIYSNTDVFIRELISNASDALEKFRHIMLTEEPVVDKEIPLEIRISIEKEAGNLVIEDTGVGMTKEELIENLGTIAHSGTAEFLKQLQKHPGESAEIIGRFGLGFYSVFMVSDHVKVITRSYKPAAKGYVWESDGASGYTISQEEGIKRGTRIVIHLKEEKKEYLDEEKIKEIIHEYSNFVTFPILLSEKKINTVQAIWTRRPQEIKEEEYTEFYKFIANTESEPLFRLHTSSDAPIQLNALLYIPGENYEVFGLNRLDPGVHLYCNKILIQSKVKDLLPEYLRFVKGVVDSEDLPLNISRETLQDNQLVKKIGKHLTKKILSTLKDQKKEHPDKYRDFWKQFSNFIKEGANTDYENREELAELLLFESSKTKAGEWTSLEDYVSRASEDQKEIYYLTGMSREELENSPYMESFRAADIEVFYLTNPIDDFVMTSIREYKEKNLVSADNANIKLPKKEEKTDSEEKKEEKEKVDDKEMKDFLKWLSKHLKDRISEVKVSDRLVDSPALLVNPDDMMTVHMQKILEQAGQSLFSSGKKVLEINPKHDLIRKMVTLKKEGGQDELLKMLADQITDNAFMMAGLETDKSAMVRRINHIMNNLVKT